MAGAHTWTSCPNILLLLSEMTTLDGGQVFVRLCNMRVVRRASQTPRLLGKNSFQNACSFARPGTNGVNHPKLSAIIQEVSRRNPKILPALLDRRKPTQPEQTMKSYFSWSSCQHLLVLRKKPHPTNKTRVFSVAFCSPAKSLTFSGSMENPLVGKKFKVLTSQQNAPQFLLLLVL